MANRNIEYKKLIEHIEEMINLLEFDAMRSAGKAKLNSGHLESLYSLLDRYKAFEAPVAKPAPVAAKRSTTSAKKA